MLPSLETIWTLLDETDGDETDGLLTNSELETELTE
jgi:hypothetical protein